MLERIKDCICHPRFIGKYNKDKVGKIILIIALFFLMYAVIFGVRTFNENPIGVDSESYIVSKVIAKQDHTVSYNSETNKLTGESTSIVNESFGLYIFPNADIRFTNLTVNIILQEDNAGVYYGGYRVSTIKYKDIEASNFTLDGISKNNPTDIYNFKIFMSEVLESSYKFFRIWNYAEGLIMTFVTFMSLFLVSFIFAKMINPTIEAKVRAKLVLYDINIFLICAMFASLFNMGWIAYVGYALPLIYTSITFKHIIRVVTPKR